MTIGQTLARAFRRIYIRPPEPIPKEQQRLLLLVGAAMFIAGYDLNIYGFAIPQIQESLNIAEADVGRIIFVFRLGMIPAVGLAYLADRIGRRGLLIATVAGMAVATLWTAFTQSTVEFVAVQTLARICAYTEELLCIVVIAEEFGERTRGWAIGQLGALAALGAGGAALVFGFVTLLPFGWRAIYVIGAIPLIWLLWARRTLPETRRFRERQSLGARTGPLASLVRNYPGRLALLICAAVPYAFGMATAVLFTSKVLQSTHGWQPWQVTVLTIGGGMFAILGNVAAGTMSDRFGRKTVLSATVVISAVSFALFYTWASGLWLALFWTLALFTYLATDIMIAALGAELFPTSHRTVASSIRLFAWLAAGSVALLVEAELFERLGSHNAAIPWLLATTPLALVPIWFLPESATKSLEDIAAERAEPKTA
jgi:MFS family permease